MSRNIIILITYYLFVSSFTTVNRGSSEYAKLQKLEYRALQGAVGKNYIVDLTGRKDCNKTKVKYLGVVHTKYGKSYKVLTSFFVFSASSTCHGTSRIKIFDTKNRYVGEYDVGMPEGLPDILQKNKLLYLENLEDCNLRKTRSIDLSNGLPKRFFIQCSKNGGDEYFFSTGG